MTLLAASSLSTGFEMPNQAITNWRGFRCTNFRWRCPCRHQSLYAVALVHGSKPPFSSLSHIIEITPAVDAAVEMALCQAVTFNSISLLDRIWNSSSPETEPSPADAGPGNGGEWSRRRYLRTDKNYNRFQFRRGMEVAVQTPNMENKLGEATHALAAASSCGQLELAKRLYDQYRQEIRASPSVSDG
jgi:hypothetical protein